MAGRMFKKAVQQGRSERRGEAYSGPYVEPLSDVRTPLADFFNILPKWAFHFVAFPGSLIPLWL
jgi:hypothetical protein